ncbi:MAG: thiolase family protein [Caldisphaeraceae archaeon]|nr:thiolase family protein [Caldisphaeraceae archaeon]MEB3798581.1 thiolase family protein [Caldisphaeraceae archaeon]
MPKINGVYIVDGLRSPVGKFGGKLKNVNITDLAAYTLKSLIERVGISPKDIEFAIYGHVIRGGTGMNTARQTTLKAGVPEYIDAMTVDMVCASGMNAVITAANYIETGSFKLIATGGMESMSGAPFLLGREIRWGVKHLIGREMKILDSMIYDGLYDAVFNKIMGEEADMTAKEYNADRDTLDWISYESHMRAGKAWDNGLMKDFVIPYEVDGKIIIDQDEGIRRDTSLEKLKALRPAFIGVHTAGSSSQISDGAASILVAGEDTVKEMGLKPVARILGFEFNAVETWKFPAAPVGAIKKLLKSLNWSVDDVDYWENNEAFAVNSFIAHKEIGIPYEKMNVHGGAIAIGHPLGMSGARITLELINVLKKHGGKRGIASICHGLGGASAIALELL